MAVIGNLTLLVRLKTGLAGYFVLGMCVVCIKCLSCKAELDLLDYTLHKLYPVLSEKCPLLAQQFSIWQ